MNDNVWKLHAVAKLPEEDGAEDAEGRGPPHGAQAVQVSEMILSPSYDIASI